MREKIRYTYTVVELELPKEMFEYIKKKLLDAKYFHCFSESGKTIDMAGICVVAIEETPND